MNEFHKTKTWDSQLTLMSLVLRRQFEKEDFELKRHEVVLHKLKGSMWSNTISEGSGFVD